MLFRFQTRKLLQLLMFLLHVILLPFGFPAILQSNRGVEFLNAVMLLLFSASNMCLHLAFVLDLMVLLNELTDFLTLLSAFIANNFRRIGYNFYNLQYMHIMLLQFRALLISPLSSWFLAVTHPPLRLCLLSYQLTTYYQYAHQLVHNMKQYIRVFIT